MELSLILLKQVIVMLVYLGLGAIGYKCGLISVEGNKSISKEETRRAAAALPTGFNFMPSAMGICATERFQFYAFGN